MTGKLFTQADQVQRQREKYFKLYLSFEGALEAYIKNNRLVH